MLASALPKFGSEFPHHRGMRQGPGVNGTGPGADPCLPWRMLGALRIRPQRSLAPCSARLRSGYSRFLLTQVFIYT